MPDKSLVCGNCGTEFDFTEDEQAFYKENGWEYEPTHCPMCKRAYKNDRRSQDWYYNKY